TAGVNQGDRIAGYLPRVPETLAIMLGTWKVGGVYVPIFTGFGADAVAYRVKHSGARVLCTHADYRDGVPPMPSGTVVMTLGGERGVAGDVVFGDAVAGRPVRSSSAVLRRVDQAVLLFI